MQLMPTAWSVVTIVCLCQAVVAQDIVGAGSTESNILMTVPTSDADRHSGSEDNDEGGGDDPAGTTIRDCETTLAGINALNEANSAQIDFLMSKRKELEAALAESPRKSGACTSGGNAAAESADAEKLGPLLDAVDAKLEQLEARLP